MTRTDTQRLHYYSNELTQRLYPPSGRYRVSVNRAMSLLVIDHEPADADTTTCVGIIDAVEQKAVVTSDDAHASMAATCNSLGLQVDRRSAHDTRR
jgi:hypothetical protein